MESSLQDQLIDQFHDLILARAADAGAAPGRGGGAAAASTAALLPLLAALADSGAAGSVCIGRACAALRARKRLKGKQVAAGLQSIIAMLGKCQPLSVYTHID